MWAKWLNYFKNKLDKYWEKQEVVFNDHKSEIITRSHKKVVFVDEDDNDSSQEDLAEPALETIAK